MLIYRYISRKIKLIKWFLFSNFLRKKATGRELDDNLAQNHTSHTVLWTMRVPKLLVSAFLYCLEIDKMVYHYPQLLRKQHCPSIRNTVMLEHNCVPIKCSSTTPSELCKLILQLYWIISQTLRPTFHMKDN